MIRKAAAALFLAALSFLAFGQTSPAAQSSYSFEFYNFETNRYVTTFPFGHANEVIVASQTQDVRNQLPIGLSLKIDSTEKWTATIANNPTQACRGATGCSTRGPVINDPGASSYVELTATGKANGVLATYTSGTPPSRATRTTQAVNQSTNQPAAANPGNSWWRWWWGVGFIVGIVWLFPWIFVGWQWSRFGFWGFGWPWPWWFWLPLIWFIPWLIIAWIWWFDWWLWWAWWWWLFPWIFWWFWWVIVFKELTIWQWRQNK